MTSPIQPNPNQPSRTESGVIQPGTKLGIYEIRSFVGAGGMASVYLAQDLRHNRPVAIKLMNMSLAVNVQAERRANIVFSERFRREIEIAARLSHPHIVPLHDSGIYQNQPYYVMPFVSGESLRQRLQREKSLSVEEAIRLTTEIASALGYAHLQGLIHRDIKPENVLLSDGIALVADFGIARAMESNQESAFMPGEQQSALTMEGAAVGTPAYMSPEQFEGAAEIDGRSDLYSLGCVLYEMLAGRPPFDGSPYSLAHQHLSDTPRSLTDFRKDVPPHVSRAVAKTLAKHPSARFATAADLGYALSTSSQSATTMKFTVTDIAPNNLPKERTRFIGREDELVQCANLLSNNRLLTLTALGGSGKTRLAIKLAEHLSRDNTESYTNGVWFVDLSSLSDESRVVDTVAEVLGVRQDADKDLLQSLVANVADKRSLLVLDNCEHLLHSCASLVDELLNVCSELRILVTSREALGVRGERVFALRPLSVPSTEAAKDDATDAVKLFVDRAQLAQTSFEMNNDNFGDVAEICRRLDGIPLAIELAAARVRVLSVSQIREKLSDRFRLLTSDGRAALPRHQTLQAAIHWSYEQLSPDEQRLIRSLSVFAGGWTMELALKVGGPDRLDEFEMLDLLTHLIDKSLVIVESERSGERRYSMLETVREFTTALLVDAGEIQAVRKEHLQAFLDLAESAYAERVSREQEWANVLQAEIDNLRVALEFARTNDSERYLELVGALTWFWQVRSHLREGREHLTAALSLSGSESVNTARARALWGAAHMLSWQGDPITAQTWMAHAIKLWRELGDDRELAFALEGLGWAQCLAADDETARNTFAECLKMQQAVGDSAAINRATVGLAQALVALSKVEEARALALEIITFSEQHNDKRSEHFGWHFLADCALIEGNGEESLRLYKRSLGVAQQLGDQLETSFEVQGVAMSLAGLGQSHQAVLLAEAAKAEWDRIGADIHIGFWDRLLERYIGSAKKSLSEEELTSTLSEARSLPFDEAVRLALDASS